MISVLENNGEYILTRYSYCKLSGGKNTKKCYKKHIKKRLLTAIAWRSFSVFIWFSGRRRNVSLQGERQIVSLAYLMSSWYPVTGCVGIVQSCTSGGLDCTLGSISSPKGWSNAGTGFMNSWSMAPVSGQEAFGRCP